MRANRDRAITKDSKRGKTAASNTRDRYWLQCDICDHFKANLVPHLRRYHGISDNRVIANCLESATRVKKSTLVQLNHQPEPVLKRMVPKFEEFLRSPIGSCFSQNTARAHGRRFSTFCKELAGEGREFNLGDLRLLLEIGNDGGLVSQWVNESRFKAGYVTNLLVSTKHFLRFVTVNKEFGLGWVTRQTGIDEYLAHLNGIQGFLSKIRRRETVANDDAIGTDTIDQLAWSGYNTSDTWRTIQGYLEKLLTNPNVTTASTNLTIRNHLILRLFLDNFRRAGDIAHFSLVEFNKAELVEGDYVTTIRRHKTDGKYAAPLVMKSEVKRAIKIYIRSARETTCPAEDQQCAFLTTTGRPLDSSDINKNLKAAWGDYGRDLGRDIGEITATKVRRSAVTITRQAKTTQEDRRQVSQAMCHDIDIADKIYDRSGQREQGQSSATIVKHCLQEVMHKKYGHILRGEDDAEDEIIPPTPPRPNKRLSLLMRRHGTSESEDVNISTTASPPQKRCRPTPHPGPEDEESEEEFSMAPVSLGSKATKAKKQKTWKRGNSWGRN
ncbi:uncharacterized protein LOC135489252 isoform X1 [Lineus longissimus]|uniref:uncharacterized protein LOC135489252 isoform X1 n=1 Tax=Lineus longissimus TaxID=88925 RepID=UPI00315C8660